MDDINGDAMECINNYIIPHLIWVCPNVGIPSTNCDAPAICDFCSWHKMKKRYSNICVSEHIRYPEI